MNIKRQTTSSIRPLIRPLVLALTVAGLPAMTVASASTSTAATCSTTTARWGSTAKTLNRMTTAPITNLRAGRHTCFDRLVVDLRGRGAGYDVRYVSQVHTEGQGAVVPLRGGARLAVVVKAPDHNANGTLTYRPANRRELANVAGFSTFRQIAWAGSFEGQTTIGLGVRARLPMRVFILNSANNRSHVVVDVAHHW